MTTDRDVRFSELELAVTARAMRAEVTKRTRSIDKAEAARAAGATIQHGTLEAHYRARDAARHVLENLEVARRQIAHQIARAVELDREEG